MYNFEINQNNSVYCTSTKSLGGYGCVVDTYTHEDEAQTLT